MFLLFLKDVTRPCAILGVHCTLETRTWNTGPGNKTVWSTAPLGCGRACVRAYVCVCRGGVSVWVGGRVCVVSSSTVSQAFTWPYDFHHLGILLKGRF